MPKAVCKLLTNIFGTQVTFSVNSILKTQYLLVAVGSSGILKWKQKLVVTFNSDKLGGIDFTKFSKLTMCSAKEEAQPSLF